MTTAGLFGLWLPAMLGGALAQTAPGFELAFPVDCTLGESCFIQNYLDHDPGPSVLDFHCGALSYDGHDGTDIALATVADLDRKVAIRAVAPGKVLGIRNTVADNAADVETPVFPQGQDCGNGVLIDHGQGWQSQYCHMAQGSVSVSTGDLVETGTELGLMGLSGKTQFPHLHLALRKDGKALDPFAPEAAVNCLLPDGGQAQGLWETPLPYEAGGLIGIGIADRAIDFTEVKAGLPETASLPADAPALLVWAHLFGARSGDEVKLVITGPEGVLVEQNQLLERSQARAFRMLGKKRAETGRWSPGQWSASATLIRAGKPVSTRVQSFTITE